LAERSDSRVSATSEVTLRGKTPLALVGACTLALVIAAGAGAWRLFWPSRSPATTRAVVGETLLALPTGYFRPASRGGGRLEKLQLAAFFPDFTPAGDLGDVNSATNLADRYEKLVFVTIEQSDASLDPADRPVKLYARFLDPEGWTHPGGLIARAFLAGSPFEGEELYFIAPEGREFAARCGKPDEARKTPNFCIDDFRVDQLAVELRFSANLLSEWQTLMSGARGLIESGRRAGS
jgi:hypothetical protein